MWIHEHNDWPNFRWDTKKLVSKLSDVRFQQGKLLGRMNQLGFPYAGEANVRSLTDEVVKSSAIEGELLDANEVRSSIARRLGVKAGGLVPVGRDVDAIVELMIDATHRFDLPMTADRLFRWHAALFPTGQSGVQRIATGKWRGEDLGPMRVVSGAIGREKVHFEAPSADRVPLEMQRFLNWFEGPVTTDPVLRAGVAHFWFVTIHPFEDGNGRVARAIGELGLARADGSTQRYYSLSAQIEAERAAYYRQLESQQRRTPDITSWLSWFLDCLGRALERADKRLSSLVYKAAVREWVNQDSMNARQRKILDRMLEDEFEGFMNTGKYAKMAKCSTDSALRDIQDFKKRGVFVQNPGGGRSTSYRILNDAELQERRSK